MKTITKEQFISKLSKGLTDFYGKEISFGQVQDQLLLIEMGKEPTDEVIGTWIKKTANNGNKN
jgi:hypothetical protein